MAKPKKGSRPTVPTLEGPRVVLRAPNLNRHLDALVAMFAAPEVARWWPDMDETEVRRALRDDDILVWVIERDGDLVGFVQVYEETDPDYRHAGLDIALWPNVRGRGLGPEAIAVLCDHLIDARDHHRFVIDPSVDNAAAIRAYEKVGFRPVGVMREYEYDHTEKRWSDGLLMDLLARELVPAADIASNAVNATAPGEPGAVEDVAAEGQKGRRQA